MPENRKNYIWLAGQIRNKIENEEWGSSEKIPPERELSREFGVTRVTIRRALRILEGENRIRRIRGSGTFVNPKRIHRIPLMIDYTGTMNTYAPNMRRKLVKKNIITPSEVIAAELKVKPNTRILYAIRVDLDDNTAVAYDQAYIPQYFAVNLTDNELQRVDFLETWAKAANIQITHCQQYIEAVAADESCVKYLKMSYGDPVLKSTEFYYADNKKIAGMFISFYHPKHISINSRYDWREKTNNGNS